MPSSRAIACVTSTMRCSIARVDRLRRIDADRVARVNAGALDVLEDAGNRACRRRRRRRRPRPRGRADTCRRAAARRAESAAPTPRTTRAALRCRRSPSRGRPARTTGARAPGNPVRARSRALRGNCAPPCPAGRATPSRASAASNCSRSSAMSSDCAIAADDRNAARAQFAGEIDRGLAAEGEHHAARVRSPR